MLVTVLQSASICVRNSDRPECYLGAERTEVSSLKTCLNCDYVLRKGAIGLITNSQCIWECSRHLYARLWQLKLWVSEVDPHVSIVMLISAQLSTILGTIFWSRNVLSDVKRMSNLQVMVNILLNNYEQNWFINQVHIYYDLWGICAENDYWLLTIHS